MRHATFRFLGTGSSIGTPVIGCTCSVCTSTSSKNHRLRVSGLISVADKQFLIDAGPDIRFQLLRAGVSQLTGVLITHTHYDHIGGLDDLRPFCFSRKDAIPCLLSQESLEELKQRVHYLIQQHSVPETPYTKLYFHIIPENIGKCEFEGFTWKLVTYYQQEMQITGYILGNLAYISDIKDYSDQVVQTLQGIDHLIVGALRQASAKSHFTIEEAIAFAGSVKAKNTYITHLGHEVDHEAVSRTLPRGVSLAYDGLEVAFEVFE